MAEKKGYRGLSNPARICAQLQKSIAKSPSNGVTIDEVRQLIRNEDEGVWSEQDVIGFFTNSPQKVFVLRGDQLFLRNVDESSSEDEAPRRVKSKARDVVRKEEVPESCRNCEKLVASTDEILREAEVLDKRVAERMDFLKEKQNIVQRLRNDRDRAENDIASSSMRDSDAALNGRDSSLARKTECKTAFSVSQRKLEIFRQMNSSRRLLTQRQIQEHVVFPPSQRHHRKITLVSSDDESSSDGEKFTSGKYEMVPSEQRCYSSDEDIARSRDPVPIPVVEQKENAIIETGIKDLMRTQWERRDPGGLFNFYEGLTRETRDRHDLGTIVNDLRKFTARSLTDDEILAYLTYFQLLSGGNLKHLSSKSVVAAVLNLYETDRTKQKLRCIMENMQPKIATGSELGCERQTAGVP